MSHEKPQESKYEFSSRKGEQFSVSDDVMDSYHHVVELMNPEGKLTYVPTESQVNEAKSELHNKFIAENKGVNMPVDELLENLDVLASPL